MRLDVLAHDHDLVADRLDHARVVGQRVGHVLDEPLHVRDRLVLALLLGVAGVAGQVAEGDAHADPAQVLPLLALHLHVADHVLLHVVLQEALVHEVHQRRRHRQQVASQVLHLLGHLDARDALAHQRLVHVQVEQPHLGVGDLAQRLAVHPRQLQECHQREAGGQHRCRVLDGLEILVGHGLQTLGGQAQAGPEALDQRRLETGQVGGVVHGAVAVCVREQLLEPVRGQPPLVGGGGDLVQLVPALAQAGDQAGVAGRLRGPGAGLAPLHLGDQARPQPAAQGGRRHPGDLCGLA